MISELLLILKSTFLLFFRLIQAIPAEGWNHALKRLFLFTLIWLLFALLNTLHIIGHILDEIFFYKYRSIKIKRPVFIIGVPRSGTTLLQRIMAEDNNLTTLQTWEAVFAPSISERYFFSFMGKLLSPFSVFVKKIRQVVFKKMDQIHEIRLKAAEEDFLLLLPLEACFLVVLLCPNSTHYLKLAAFDVQFDEKYRQQILSYYQRCLQKHLFYHGAQLRVLSKNPSFTPFHSSLSRQFPDASFIACIRPPEEVVPSQLSSLQPAMQILASGRCNPVFEAHLIEILKNYYSIVQENFARPNFKVVPLIELKQSLTETVLDVFDFLHMPISTVFLEHLHKHDVQAKQYQSAYRSHTKALALNVKNIQHDFRLVWPPSSGTKVEIT